MDMVTSGTPYHRLAAGSRTRPWVDAVLVLILAAVAAFVVMVAGLVPAAIVGSEGPDGIPTLGALGDTAVHLAAIATGIPLVLLAARWRQRRPAGTVSSVTGRLRLRWLGLCLLVAAPATALMMAASLGLLALGPGLTAADFTGWVGWPRFAVAAVVLAALVPLQAAGEEYVFRGWLPQALGRYGAVPAVALPALVFAVAHGLGTWWGFVDLLAFGLVTGWLTIRTGGLEAAIATHAAVNLTAFGLAAATGALAETASAAEASWQLAVADVTALLLYAGVVAWLARRRGLVTTAAARPGSRLVTAVDLTPLRHPDPVQVGGDHDLAVVRGGGLLDESRRVGVAR